MFEWIKKLFKAPIDLEECQAKNIAYAETIKNLQQQLVQKGIEFVTSLQTNVELRGQIEQLNKQLNPIDEQEEYWNNKRPKQNITYSGRCLPNQTDRTFETDVRIFFTPYDNQLREIVNKNWTGIGKPIEGSNDEKALKCLKWVRKNFKYESDKSVTGLSEFWMFPFEALKYGKGDCDDGSILLANLMLCSGIPYYRIRLNCGDVKAGAKKEGHCFVTYCRETDNQFVVLDWCWYKDIPISQRKLHQDEKDYYGCWFSWNQKYAFGEMQTMAKMDKRRFNDKKRK